MEVRSKWYDGIVREINLHRDTLGKKDAKKYKLDLLTRVAKRIDSFSSECGQCQISQQEVTTLTQDLGYLAQWSKERRRSYFKMIGTIVKHLQKQHKLVSEGYYIGIGLAIGVGIGTALGAALGSPGIGPAIGTALGLAIGKYLDNKAKKEGRVI